MMGRKRRKEEEEDDDEEFLQLTHGRDEVHVARGVS